MYNVSPPVLNHMDDYDEIVRSRSAPFQVRLVALRAVIIWAYNQYNFAGVHGASMGTVTPLTLHPDDHSALYSNFDRLSTGKPCDKIRQELLASAQDGMCPYCRLHDATTLDHILERSDYAELSVLRTNLAPVCGLCNTTKQNTKTSVSHLEPFHLYYRGFPSSDYLDVAISVTAARVDITFKLTHPPTITTDWFSALQRHFIGLKLAQRYQRRARSELRDRLLDMRRVYAKGGHSRVATFLERDAESRASNWSDQDWLPTLLRAAAQSQEFCDGGFDVL